MAFEKGQNTNRKGKPNKTGKVNQEFWQLILDRQAERIEQALDKVFTKNPGQYLTLLMEMSEFVMPKMARHEFATEEGDTLQIPIITIKHEQTTITPNEP